MIAKPLQCIQCGTPTEGRYCSDPCKEEGGREQQRINDIIIDMNLEADLERAAEECFGREPA